MKRGCDKNEEQISANGLGKNNFNLCIQEMKRSVPVLIIYSIQIIRKQDLFRFKLHLK